MMRRLLFFILLLFLTIEVSVAATVHLYGYVYTDNGKIEPAEQADIIVKGTTTGTTARADGYYDFLFEVTDTATVEYSYSGYIPFFLKVKADDGNIEKRVYLQKITNLQSVQVEAIAKTDGTNKTIDLAKLGVIPNATGGIENALITQGIITANDFSSQYSVRGGNYDENSVYVNNIEIYRPQLIQSGQQEGLSFINPDLVESVSFSAGGFDAKYGDKMASVLDIEYKKPKGLEASVSASLLGATAHFGQASKNGKFTQIHGIRYKSSNYLLGSLETEGTYNQQFVDYQGYLTYHFLPKWEIAVLGNFSQNKYVNIPESQTTTYGTYLAPTTFRVFFDGEEKDLFQTIFGAATLTYSPLKAMDLSLITSAYTTRESVNYDISGEYWLGELDEEGNESNTLGVGAYQNYARDLLKATVMNISHRGNYNLKNQRIDWGVGLQRELINDKTNEFQTRDSAGYSMPYRPDELTLYYNLYSDDDMSSYRTQGFVQDKWKISLADKSLLTITGGVRANYWTFNHELIVSPRATVAYFPNWKHEFGFRFSTGLYYQSPFYKEVRDTITDAYNNVTVRLNDHIKAQRSVHLVLGSDYYFKISNRPFRFTTELFYKPADRIISYTVDNVKIIYAGENNAKAYAAGIDFKLFGALVPGTDSWINLSLMRAKEDIEGDDVGYVSRPNEQRYNFSMFFQDYFPLFPKYKFHLKAILADGLPFWAPNASTHTDENTNRSKAYRRVDIGVSRSFVKGDIKWLDKTHIFGALKSIDIGLEVFNLLDIRNIASYYWVTDIYGRQNAIPNRLTGRQFNVKLTVNFW